MSNKSTVISDLRYYQTGETLDYPVDEGVSVGRFFVAALLVLVSFAVGQETLRDVDRKIVKRVPPVYPDLARRLNLDGLVKLRVTVSPDGTVKATELLGGNPVLAKSAQDALFTWRWAPAEHESKEIVELRFHH